MSAYPINAKAPVTDEDPAPKSETHEARAAPAAKDPEAAAPAEPFEQAEVTQHIIAMMWQPSPSIGRPIMWQGSPAILHEQLQSIATASPENTTVDVWLQSPGGLADDAYRHMLALRSIASTIRVVVGTEAKSAATLFALGADQIFMGVLSELGPLDAQIFLEESSDGHPDRRISALDIAKAADHVASKATMIALTYGGLIHEVTSIPRREVLPHVLRFAADFVHPIVSKLEPAELYRAQSHLNLARDYAIRLLGRRTDAMPAEAAIDLTDKLVQDYADHGFVIDLREAEELGLPALPWSEYEHLALFKAFAEKADTYTSPCLMAVDFAVLNQAQDDDEVADDHVNLAAAATVVDQEHGASDAATGDTHRAGGPDDDGESSSKSSDEPQNDDLDAEHDDK